VRKSRDVRVLTLAPGSGDEEEGRPAGVERGTWEVAERGNRGPCGGRWEVGDGLTGVLMMERATEWIVLCGSFSFLLGHAGQRLLGIFGSSATRFNKEE
jgi:hypothetical protein